MIAVIDRNLRITRASEELAQMLGRAPVDLHGAPLDRFVEGDFEGLRAALEHPEESRVSLSSRPGARDVCAFDVTVIPLADRSGAVLDAEPSIPAVRQHGLEEVLDRVSDGFAVWDRAWRYVHVNHAAEAFYGRPREELIGRNVWELYPGAIGSELERQMRRAAVEREPVELETVSPQFHRWIRYRFFPFERGLALFFRDVDEEHRMRETLRESEERHRSMFEHSLVGWMLTAPDGRILSVNPAACRMLRRTEAEIVSLGREGVVDPGDARVSVALEERRRTGRVLAELTLKRGDGTLFPAIVSSAIFRDAHGEERTSLSFYDITERRQAEDALTYLAEAGGVLAGSLDVQDTLQALARFLVPRLADCCTVELFAEGEARCAAAMHRDPTRDLGDLCAGPWKVAVDEVVRTSEARLVETVDEVWLEWAAGGDPDLLARARACEATSMVIAPLVAHGRTLGALVTAYVDETRRYDASSLMLAGALAERAALAVDNARRHLDAIEARRLRDEVLGFVAHDLRSPLQTISMSAAALAPEDGGRALEILQRSVAHADRLIQDLLTVAMLEGGTLPLERGEEGIASVVTDVIELHRPLAEARSVTLAARVPPDAGVAAIDRHRVVQVLSNLVSNALKFTPEGGRVDVEVEPGPDAVEIHVRDTGCGIDPQEVHRVFDRFWQSARKRRGGAGLGLAIAKGIADAHGGTLTVESVLGRGTTFCLALPRRAPNTERAAAAAAPIPS